jgi:GTP-binding protein
MSEPVVAIVGRPNVGKSTLFNRLIGRRLAIVDDKPGVTRDRNYSTVQWSGQEFLLIDTGGYLPESEDVMDKAIREQVAIAIEEADVILFVVDVRTGITMTDTELARMLQNAEKSVILVVNKVDDKRYNSDVMEFYKLGLGDPQSVSAMIGRETGDLLDMVCERLPHREIHEEDNNAIKLAIVGKENVGKSSLVNTLLNRERQIVTDVPGTTRDSIDSEFKYQKRDYIIIDTAGLKKKAKVHENILFYSSVRTYRSINRADVVIYMVSSDEGLTKQDVQVLFEATKERKGVLLVFNKWDLVEKDHKTMDAIRRDVHDRLGELRYIPTLFTSVSEKQRLYKAIDMATEIYDERKRRVPTSQLNEFFEPIFRTTTPPAVRGKEIKLNYVTQVKSDPPLFAFYSNFPALISDNYRRFLENKLREHFGFQGVPISISFRKK